MKLREAVNFAAIVLFVYVIADPISESLGASVQTESLKELSTIQLVVAILLAPIFEEIISRTHLSGEKRHAWSIFLMAGTLVLVFRDLGMFLIIPVILLSLFIIWNYNRFVALALQKYYNFTFYVTSVVFVMLHYPVIDVASPASKLIILLASYLPISVYFGYIRKKYGLLSSITVHSLYNVILLYINSLVY